MALLVNANSNSDVIKGQKEWLKILQNIPPRKMIRVKAIEGIKPEGADPDLYMWRPFPNIWHKITQPIYTRGILPNEILIDPDTPEWNVMREGIEKLTEYCKKNNIPYITGFSGGKGVHVSIFFNQFMVENELGNDIENTGIDVFRTVRRALITTLAEKAGLDPDNIQMDWGKINFNIESKGSQVRTFGTVRAPGQYKTLIDKILDHKPDPYELPLVFPEKVELWEIENTEFKEIAINALKKEVHRAKKSNEYSLTDADFTGIEIMKFPCVKRLFESGIKNGRYYAGLSVLLMCRRCGITKEETEKHMRELFKTFPGITQSETELRINNALTIYKTDKKFSCRELKDSFGEDFCKFSECPVKEKIEGKNDEARSVERKAPKKIKVHFDEVAKRVLKKKHIISMRDNKQIYIYLQGIYTSEGIESVLDTEIRNLHQIIFFEKWGEINQGCDLPEHIPNATTGFVNEALAYIRAYTHITRDVIDIHQDKYINFKNKLLNLETWEFEEHSPDIKTICQIPVNYDPAAECPNITKFFKDVAKSEDIDFLEEWAGYCLTTDVSYQKALMIYGIPGTGKSIFASLLETFTGDANSSAESLQKIEEDKYRAAKLYGKLVNICSDIPSTKMHKTEVFKKLVSGLDTIDAENKYQNPFKFKNKAKLTFSANKLPEGPRDPAFYERFCLVEFCNKFRGTNRDDKNLIKKLTEESELSGFLNVALNGLKRLYENDKFSYNKSFEETEREYILNSNPVAFFMDKCTEHSESDMDSTMLYLNYAEWSKFQKLTRVSKIEFSRRLGKMGYMSHRDNVINRETGKIDGSKKITLWDNLQLKIEPIGQDIGQDENNTSCPMRNDQTIQKNLLNNSIGQDRIPILTFNSELCNLENENIEKIEKSINNKETSGPISGFSGSKSLWTGSPCDGVRNPVQQTKVYVSAQLEDDESIKKFEYMSSFRRDLKNLVRSDYNCIVESIPDLLNEFNRRNPGYKQVLGDKALLDEAEKIHKWGWM